MVSEPAGALRDDLLGLDDSIDKLFRSLMLLVDAKLREHELESGRVTGNVFDNAVARHADVAGRLQKILEDLRGSEDSTGDSTPRSTEA